MQIAFRLLQALKPQSGICQRVVLALPDTPMQWTIHRSRYGICGLAECMKAMQVCWQTNFEAESKQLTKMQGVILGRASSTTCRLHVPAPCSQSLICSKTGQISVPWTKHCSNSGIMQPTNIWAMSPSSASATGKCGGNATSALMDTCTGG